MGERRGREVVEGLRHLNDGLPEGERVGFYGLDVYSLWESLEAVTEYRQREHPDTVEAARRAYSCFESYGGNAREYARATALVPTSCEALFMSSIYGDEPVLEEPGSAAWWVLELVGAQE